MSRFKESTTKSAKTLTKTTKNSLCLDEIPFVFFVVNLISETNQERATKLQETP
jgi:hypothetical protein